MKKSKGIGVIEGKAERLLEVENRKEVNSEWTNGHKNTKYQRALFSASTGESELNINGIHLESKRERGRDWEIVWKEQNVRIESDLNKHRTSCVFVRLATRFRVLSIYTVKLRGLHRFFSSIFSSDTASSLFDVHLCVWCWHTLCNDISIFRSEKAPPQTHMYTLCKEAVFMSLLRFWFAKNEKKSISFYVLLGHKYWRCSKRCSVATLLHDMLRNSWFRLGFDIFLYLGEFHWWFRHSLSFKHSHTHTRTVCTVYGVCRLSRFLHIKKCHLWIDAIWV